MDENCIERRAEELTQSAEGINAILTDGDLDRGDWDRLGEIMARVVRSSGDNLTVAGGDLRLFLEEIGRGVAEQQLRDEYRNARETALANAEDRS